MIARRSHPLSVAAAILFYSTSTDAFVTPSVSVTAISRRTSTSSSSLFYSNNNEDNNNDNRGGDDSTFDLDTLKARIGDLRLQILENELIRPPRVGLSPQDLVQALLDGVYHNEDPRPDAGFGLLLRCSTPKWASELLSSIGAPTDYKDLDTAASALGHAMTRPHNQFAILTGESAEDEQDNEATTTTNAPTKFSVHFPSEALDFLDGTAWINVELRDPDTKELLVLQGWQLQQREDGAWLVDHIDWQDYRAEYRPGIGREEWQGTYEGRRR